MDCKGAALKQRVNEMLRRVRLDDRANEKAETFSGGMQRRLELAKGLLHHPSVLLLDEPTTGLDPGARRDLWQYLQILRDEERVTVIVTTHLMEEAEKCDRLAILSSGKLVAPGNSGGVETGDWRRRHRARNRRSGVSGAAPINQRFGVEATALDGKVRFEREQGHRFVTDVVEAFPGDIQSISVSKPTLEDVFIRRTGHRFWTEDEQAKQAEAAGKKKKKH